MVITFLHYFSRSKMKTKRVTYSKKNRYQTTFRASSSFIAGLIWATPRSLNGPTILINASSSGASNIATDVCLPIRRYRLISFTSCGNLKCFQSSITLWVFSGPNLNQRINSMSHHLTHVTTPAALNCTNEYAGEQRKSTYHVSGH